MDVDFAASEPVALPKLLHLSLDSTNFATLVDVDNLLSPSSLPALRACGYGEVGCVFEDDNDDDEDYELLNRICVQQLEPQLQALVLEPDWDEPARQDFGDSTLFNLPSDEDWDMLDGLRRWRAISDSAAIRRLCIVAAQGEKSATTLLGDLLTDFSAALSGRGTLYLPAFVASDSETLTLLRFCESQGIALRFEEDTTGEEAKSLVPKSSGCHGEVLALAAHERYLDHLPAVSLPRRST